MREGNIKLMGGGYGLFNLLRIRDFRDVTYIIAVTGFSSNYCFFWRFNGRSCLGRNFRTVG